MELLIKQKCVVMISDVGLERCTLYFCVFYRFLSVNNDMSDVAEFNEKETLKRRLFKSRDKLNTVLMTQGDKRERFKMIDDKLTNIEKELDEMTRNASSINQTSDDHTTHKTEKSIVSDNAVQKDMIMKEKTVL